MKRNKEDKLYDRAMKELAKEQDRYIQSLWDSTPEIRKEWDLDEWVQAIYWYKGLIYEQDCPISKFSPEQ